jgi:hypothetical protein
MSTRRPIRSPRFHTSHAQALATSPCHAREAQCRCCTLALLAHHSTNGLKYFPVATNPTMSRSHQKERLPDVHMLMDQLYEANSKVCVPSLAHAAHVGGTRKQTRTRAHRSHTCRSRSRCNIATSPSGLATMHHIPFRPTWCALSLPARRLRVRRGQLCTPMCRLDGVSATWPEDASCSLCLG